jgi:hypothetical protein
MYDTEVHGHLHISLNRYFNRFGNVVAMIITIVKITWRKKVHNLVYLYLGLAVGKYNDTFCKGYINVPKWDLLLHLC